MLVRFVLLVLAMALSSLSPARADEPKGTLKQIRDSKTIRLGHLKTGVPFSFVDKDTPQGYSVELCKRVAGGIQQQLGLDALNIQWVAVDEATRFDMVQSGKIDIECGTTTNTLSRQDRVDFSLPIWVDGATFVVKVDSPIKNHTDLAGKKVAVMTGTTTVDALKRALSNSFISAEVVLVPSHIQGLELLHQGKVDAYASDNTVLIGLALAVRATMPLRLSEAMFSYEPYVGVDMRGVYARVFTLGTALGTLGGALVIPATAAMSEMGIELIVEAFAVVVIGGLGSMRGALVGALVVGVLRAVAISVYPEIEMLLIYLIVIAVLLLRPRGLFGGAAA